jgi:carbamate kinase
MRIVVALGGNALLRRGEPMTSDNQRTNVRIAAQALATIATTYQLIITHGNGPQVGLLALQAAASGQDPDPLDVLGAETEGMIGYLIEQELGNILPPEQPFATLLTMVEVDPTDPAFDEPTKPIGPLYTQAEADRLVAERGWTVVPDGDKFRRVVPSPLPRRIFELRPIQWLLEKGVIVICGGGGGIPTVYDNDGKLRGVEAVVDKDRASALIARELSADFLILATDVDAVYISRQQIERRQPDHWQQPDARAIRRSPPAALAQFHFAAGSMAPKVAAAREFAELTGKPAAIGALHQLSAILTAEAGTWVTTDAAAIEWH